MDRLTEREIYRSAIRSQLLNHSLKRGAILGGAGALLLIIGGTFLPLSLLKIVGIPLFLTGMALIALGLWPYRQLSRLQLHPHLLQVDAESLTFKRNGKPLMQIPLTCLEKMDYLEKEDLYGIGIWLKKQSREKIKVLQPHFDGAAFMAHSQQQFEGCDLFMPYFTEATWKEIREATSQEIKDQLAWGGASLKDQLGSDRAS